MKKFAMVVAIVLLFIPFTINANEIFSQVTLWTQTQEEMNDKMLTKTLLSVVMIETQSRVGLDGITIIHNDHGTGFYVKPNVIMTNRHVLGSSKTVKLTFYDNKNVCEGKVVKTSVVPDLALIETACTGKPLVLSEEYLLGQTVYAIGHPTNYPFTVTKGILSNIRYNEKLQYDAGTTNGNSGGILVNLKGEVSGIVTQMDEDLQFIGFAIRSTEAIEFIN